MMNRKKPSVFDAVPVAKIIQEFCHKFGYKLNDFIIEKKAERPISLVFKIRLELAKNETQNIYLKYYKPIQDETQLAGLVQRDFDTTGFWYERFKKSETYKVVKPLYVDPGKLILITRESSGFCLWDYINKHGQFFPSVRLQQQMSDMTTRAGRWLNFFQDIPYQGQDSLIEIEEIIEYISFRLNRLQENPKIKFDAHLNKSILNYIRENWKAAGPKEKRKSYVHADLSLSNILMGSQTITVLDFNKIEIGSPFKDLTRFCHQLQLLKNKPTFQKTFIDNLQDSFLEGYGQPAIHNHPLFRVYLMIHVVNHLGKTARYWEHSKVENIYNRWIVRNTLNEIRKLV